MLDARPPMPASRFPSRLARHPGLGRLGDMAESPATGCVLSNRPDHSGVNCFLTTSPLTSLHEAVRCCVATNPIMPGCPGGGALKKALSAPPWTPSGPPLTVPIPDYFLPSSQASARVD